MELYSKKDIKILLKDPSALVVLLILPLMFMTIMSFALKMSTVVMIIQSHWGILTKITRYYLVNI